MSSAFALLLVLVALAVTLYPLARPVRRRLAQRIGRVRELEERYRSALADLQDIEMDRQVGNLAEGDYEEMRERLRLRAAGVLVEIAAEANARARLAGVLGERTNGHAAVEALPRASRRLALGPVVAGSVVLALASVAGIGALYVRLVAEQNAQAPLSTLVAQHAHTVLVGTGADLWVGHHTGMLRSGDGRTWQSTLPAGDVMAVIPLAPRHWLALGHELVWESLDDGSTWAPVAHDLPDADIHGAQLIGTDLYAYVVGFGIFHTRDGQAWQVLAPSVNGNVTALAALEGAPTPFYLAMDGKLFRSFDGGRTWADSAGAGNLALIGQVRSIVADPGLNVLYAATSDGLFQSTTAGNQWIRMSFKGAVAAVGVKGQVVGLVDDKNQLFLSRDGGVTWGG
ncbi:MAG: hypothetical protein EXR58_03750 [Chloroflexi bacterium]|nr:hypothetical protein [Chloroflexota bacterium]